MGVQGKNYFRLNVANSGLYAYFLGGNTGSIVKKKISTKKTSVEHTVGQSLIRNSNNEQQLKCLFNLYFSSIGTDEGDLKKVKYEKSTVLHFQCA